MNTAYFRELYEYDRWANARVLAAASTLSPEDFVKNLGGSFSSVRDTLVHILSGERTWLSRWKGASPTAKLEPSKYPDVAALQPGWAALEKELAELLDSLTEERLLAPVAYATLAGQPQSQPLWQQMAHLVNHSSYHRGQVATMLRQLGAQPIASDLIVYFRERAS